MAVINVLFVSACPTEGHVRINFSLNGGSSKLIDQHIEEFTAPLTDEEFQAAAKVILRLHKLGKTALQMKLDLVAGFAVVI